MRATYFSHDEDARNDPKVTKLRTKFGMEGYGCYFALLEMFSTESAHRLDYSQEQFEAIAYDLHCTLNVKEFIDKCLEVGLLQTDGETFWSESFNRRLEAATAKAKRRSEKSQKAANARWSRAKQESQVLSPIPQEDILSLDSLNQDWVRFVHVYEQNLGLIPHGGTKTGQLIEDYFDELGADVMCKAVEVTNLAQPDKPAVFMLAILKKWVELGVKTVEQAEAATKDHNRKASVRARRQGQQTDEAAGQANGIRGKFY